jgi:hypothetical protein
MGLHGLEQGYLYLYLLYGTYEGRLSKQITNGSKTAVIDIIGFICVSLGSSTAQLHDTLGSRCVCACSDADFSSQNGDRASGVY